MTVFEAIEKRRSIRHFRDMPVEREKIIRALDAARLSPSGHNRQPWRFVVVESPQKKQELFAIFLRGIESGENAAKLTCHYGYDSSSMKNSCMVIQRAPVSVLVFHTGEYCFNVEPGDFYGDNEVLTDQQSIGSAVENFILAAREMDLGALWVGHTVSIFEEVRAWLGTNDILVATIALGYPTRWPSARPRKSLDEIVNWI